MVEGVGVNFALKVELRMVTRGKPWHAEVFVEGLPLLDARGNVVTVSKAEAYALDAGGARDHWIIHLATHHRRMRNITPTGP